tara:strand:+ start:1420 stop:1611 length:192 start_codon:yes stop_codon:yes gene_type:complete
MISYLSTLNQLRHIESKEEQINVGSIINNAIKDIESIGGSVRVIEGNTLTLVNVHENRLRSRL